MNKDVAKKAYETAEKELEEQNVKKLKELVKLTLTKIADLDEQIDELQEEKKILKLDLEDLKEGHLDRIAERQEKDAKAKKVSVIIVEKEIHHYHDYINKWFEPYKIYPASSPAYPYPAVIYSDNTLSTLATNNMLPFSSLCNSGTTSNSIVEDVSFTVNSSLVKDNVAGTYNTGKKIIHFR